MTWLTRRTFLITSATGAAAAVSGSRCRAGVSANETINVGIIGVGWRGGQHLDALSKLRGVRVSALCDPDSALTDARMKDFPDAKAHADLRRVLDDANVDAVVIATCNHWHCVAAVWACEAGKDVYVEKPLSHHLWEGRQLIDAARKNDRIVQVGTQQRSDPMQDEIKDFLHTKKALGAIESVAVLRFGVRAPIGKRSTPLDPPATLNYDLWLGPAQDQPIYRDKWHYDWHWDWNTGAGECGNWGVHILDDVRNVVFKDKVNLPERVACGGGRVVWQDAGTTPNVQFASLLAGGTPMLYALSNLPAGKGGSKPLQFDGVDTGYVVKCEGGAYHGARGQGTALDKDGKVIRRFRGDSGAAHLGQFFDAMRGRDAKLLKAPLDVGHASTGWCHVINAAYRIGAQRGLIADAASGDQSAAHGQLRDLLAGHLAAHGLDASGEGLRASAALAIDAAAERIVGPCADEANVFLDKPAYRPGYEIG